MNTERIIDLVIKEAHIERWALLQQQQIVNMVNQFAAKNKVVDKEPYFKYAIKLNEIIKKLSVDFKTEKLLLIWLLEQVLNKNITKIEEDSQVIEENLNLYFKNRGEIKKNIFNLSYKDIKEAVQPFKKGGEEAEHQEFLSKPVAEGAGYKIYKITDKSQCLRIGKGTSWCIQGDEWATKYLKKGSLYLVTKNDKRFALLQFESVQFMDVHDVELKPKVAMEIFEVWPESEKLLEKAVKRHGRAIKYIKNPSEQVQLEAVKQNGWAIKHIKNPSEQVQLEAVKQYGNAIEYIKNPSEQVQLEAVKENGYAIYYIENPSEQVQLE